MFRPILRPSATCSICSISTGITINKRSNEDRTKERTLRREHVAPEGFIWSESDAGHAIVAPRAMSGQVIAHERIKQTASLPTSSHDFIEEQ
jgi:hypothetical protein